jgi:DNA repair exonuclease SbcCD ATPase subunit
MYTIHGQRLNNVVYFKDAKIKLDKNPLTFVRGLNFDGDAFDPTSNGAGKSLLFSCIPNIFYFSPPTATRKNSKKELLAKTSKNGISFSTPDGTKYVIIQTSKKYIIKENGVDLKFSRIPDAEKFIRKIFPLLEIDYYTYCYISTQRPYLLQTDTDTNRLDHLTSIFRLDSYDLMKSYFLKALAEVKSSEVKLSVLEQKKVELDLRLKKLSQREKELSNKAILKAHKSTLDKKVRALTQLEFKLSNELATLRTLRKVEVELDELRKHYTYSEKPSAVYASLVKERKLIRSYENYLKQLKTYKANIAAIQEKIDKITLPEQSKKQLKARKQDLEQELKASKKKLKLLEEKERSYLAQKKLISKTKETLDSLDIDVSKVDLDMDYTQELAQVVSSLKLNSLLEHEHFDEEQSACPVCLSKVDIARIKKVVATAKKQLPRVKAFAKAKNLLVDLKQQRKDIAEIEYSPEALKELKQVMEKVEEKLTSTDKALSAIDRHTELYDSLELIERPAVVERPDTSMSVDEVDSQIELCSNIIKHLEAKDKLLENNSALAECRTVSKVEAKMQVLQGEHSEVQAKLSSKRKKLVDIVEKLEVISAVTTELSLVKTELSELNDSIDKLKPAVEDKQLLEVLVKAYSTKGLKTIRANDICSLLEANLNFYRDLIFVEPFEFSVKATDSGLSIMVDRKNGIVSDVRTLSGAESNSFRMLFVLSILVLIPAERRLSMIVLDEPCSHSDEVSRELFLTKFLPVLQEVVPHVYVITPHKSDYVEGSSLLLVKKEKGVSSLHTKY